jgi:hypothetical protein
MSEANRIKYLRIALLLVGVTFIVGIYTLTVIWPSGWTWHTGPMPHYLQMILGVYAALGAFLLVASRNPLAHLGLIWFTVWSSVVHAGIMAMQSLANSEHRGHLLGDVRRRCERSIRDSRTRSICSSCESRFQIR